MLCLADNTTHPDLAALHKHLRFKLKLKQGDYYVQFYPRVCKATGAPIPFENRDQYFETDFISPQAMKSWFKSAPRAEVAEYALQMMRNRAVDKGLSFVMGDTELQSLGWPRARFFEGLAEYASVCSTWQLKRRFDYGAAPMPSREAIGLSEFQNLAVLHHRLAERVAQLEKELTRLGQEHQDLKKIVGRKLMG